MRILDFKYPFGASQKTQGFTAEKSRDAAIAKYFSQAAKRAVKLEGK